MSLPQEQSDEGVGLGSEARAGPNRSEVVERSDEERKTNTPGSRSSWSILRDWWVEIAVWLVALASLMAIFIILKTYHGSRLEDWTRDYRVSLNTVVAVLSTIARTVIVLVVEEVISQLKWLWQLRSRPVKHLNYIDEASRGLWGSFMLPFRLRKFSYIYVGCLTMLLSLGVGPFSQQAVGTKPCVKAITNRRAWLPYTLDGLPFLNNSGALTIAELGVQTKVASACANLVARNSTPLMQGCFTGECRFPASHAGPYLSTVGVCSKCIDANQYITKVKNGTHEALQLPNNVAVFTVIGAERVTPQALVSSVRRNISWVIPSADDDFLAAFDVSIAEVTIIGTTFSGCEPSGGTNTVGKCDRPPAHKFSFDDFGDAWQKLNVYSAACTLYPCMRHHNGTVRNGTLVESLVASSPGFWPNITTGDINFLNNSCQLPSGRVNLTEARITAYNRTSTLFQVQLRDPVRTISIPTNCTFTVPMRFTGSRLETAMDLVGGNCTYLSPPTWESLKDSASNIQCTPWTLNGLRSGGLADLSSTQATMSSIADAITERMRELAVQRNFTNSLGPLVSRSITGGWVSGDVFQRTICIDFRWEWLMGPISLFLITTVFLAGTVVRSVTHRGREPLWKSSLLPILYAGPGSELRARKQSLREIKRVAGKNYVRLVQMEKGRWELVKMDGLMGQGGEEETMSLVDIPKGYKDPDTDSILT